KVLRESFPSSTISFLARSYTRDIVEGQAGLDNVILYDNNGREKPFGTVLAELRHSNYDAAIVVFPRFRLALLLWLAGIDTRVGTGYRWYSFLFNSRVYEHRKTARKHEFEYNLSLLGNLGCKVGAHVVPTMSIVAEAVQGAEAERKRLGLAPGDIVAILHPGSGGSARDWSPAKFRALAVALDKLGWKVVVTGAKGEESLVGEVVSGTGGIARASVGMLTLKELAAFIKSANLFVSNSTGPLHIAAAVGTPVIGFYPPIVACSPERWGPVTNRKAIFVPDRSRCSLCKGGPCQGNVCMDQIDVQQVVDAAIKLVGKQEETKTTHIPVHQ
ncbi:MAG TPA: glycosyltransferase family 9 protein, partial [Bacteroidota bacterium]